MLRRLLIVLVPAVSSAAIWPEQWDTHKRVSVKPIALSAKDVWDEYGLEAAEEAVYEKFQAKGYRLKDPTSALAAYQWLGQEGRQIGNYIFRVDGYAPTQREWDLLQIQIPRLDQAALPNLPNCLPVRNLIPGSLRYVLGPASLQQFENRISPAIAAFSLGAEAQLARYKSPAGDVNLALFSYPTPQIAREKLEEFQRIPNSRAKRSGPLVAIVIAAPNPDEAERLLAMVNYQASITWTQPLPGHEEKTFARFILGVFYLIGVLLLFTLLAGFGYAGLRIGLRKLRGESAADSGLTTLRLRQ